MAQPSPYTPGSVAREVPGRTVQLAQIEERLDLMTALGRLVPRIRVDHGPRGVGKTSLLRQVEQRAHAKDADTIWVTAGESAGLVPAIADGAERLVRRWPARMRRQDQRASAYSQARRPVAPGPGRRRPRRSAMTRASARAVTASSWSHSTDRQ